MSIRMPIIRKKDKNGSYSYYSSKTSYSNIGDSTGKFAIIEGFKIARTNIQFSLSASNENSFSVTSWSKGEGKSTATSNIAISFSKMEKKVILLDCDLRRPNIHNLLKIENSLGLTSVLCNEQSFEQVVHKDVLPNLDVLTVGTIPPNPSELIASDNFANLIKIMRNFIWSFNENLMAIHFNGLYPHKAKTERKSAKKRNSNAFHCVKSSN